MHDYTEAQRDVTKTSFKLIICTNATPQTHTHTHTDTHGHTHTHSYSLHEHTHWSPHHPCLGTDVLVCSDDPLDDGVSDSVVHHLVVCTANEELVLRHRDGVDSQSGISKLYVSLCCIQIHILYVKSIWCYVMRRCHVDVHVPTSSNCTPFLASALCTVHLFNTIWYMSTSM